MSSPDCTTTLIQDLTRSLISALCVLVWDNLLTLDDEVAYIWSKPASAWVKWVFLAARYISLLSQIPAVVLCALITDARAGALPALPALRTWYICQLLLFDVNMSCAEVVLMARVYALYNRDRRIYIGLASLMVLQTILVLVGFGLSFRMVPAAGEFEYCDFVTHAPRSFLYVGGCSMAVQLVVVVLTAARYLSGEWRTVPLASLMFRDGCIVFGVISLTSFFVVAYIALDLAFAVSTCVWLVTFLSLATCRIILNIQTLPATPHPSDESTSLELTTVLTTRHIPLYEDF